MMGIKLGQDMGKAIDKVVLDGSEDLACGNCWEFGNLIKDLGIRMQKRKKSQKQSHKIYVIHLMCATSIAAAAFSPCIKNISYIGDALHYNT